MTDMNTIASQPYPQWVDLTGLPDEVVRSVRQLVGEARLRYDAPATNGTHPPVRTWEDIQAESARIAREYEDGRVTPREPTFIRRSRLTVEEFRKVLDEMAALGMGDAPPLPPDWSPHDLYEDDE